MSTGSRTLRHPSGMTTKSRFAALDGRPASFEQPLHVGAPNVPALAAVSERLAGAFERRYLSNRGQLVEEFERRVADRLKVSHCVAVSNATSGLTILARALELSGEVVMPAFTFVGTAHAMRWVGITPVFCDIRRETHALDPERVEAMITQRTSAILGVHIWGRPCDITALESLADRHGLPLLLDAAPAFGCSYGGQPIGGFGRAEVVSFHPTKVLNTFEGGAILTNDDDLAERARLMIQFGFEDEDTVVALGINAKMSEASAAMGLASLEAVDEFIATNRRHHERYQTNLAGLPGLSPVSYPEGDHSNYHYVVFEIDAESSPISRDALQQVLRAENILARRYFYPGCHRMEPYRSEQPQAGASLPETDSLVQRVLQLPTGTALSDADVDQVCEIVRLAFEHGRELSRLLPASTT
jgi:dTDP-4-amino-4,6-dideoxygalactose transaminase